MIFLWPCLLTGQVFFFCYFVLFVCFVPCSGPSSEVMASQVPLDPEWTPSDILWSLERSCYTLPCGRPCICRHPHTQPRHTIPPYPQFPRLTFSPSLEHWTCTHLLTLSWTLDFILLHRELETHGCCVGYPPSKWTVWVGAFFQSQYASFNLQQYNLCSSCLFFPQFSPNSPSSPFNMASSANTQSNENKLSLVRQG